MGIFTIRTFVCPAAAMALLAIVLPAGCGDIFTSEDEGTKKNWAVIVGISNYQSSSLNLKWAEEDALDFYDVLHSGRGWESDNLTLLTNSSANRGAIKSALEGLAKRVGTDDKVVFYFSGRGSYGPDQPPFDEADGLDEYLVPYDGLSNSSARDLSDDTIESLLAALPTNNVLVVLDAGFSGANSRSGAPSEKEKYVLRPRIGKAIDSRSVDGMSHDLARPGYVFISAAQNGVAPAESNQFRNSVFSYYFVEGLRGAAGRGKKTSAQQAFEYAAPRTSGYAAQQLPQILDNMGKGFPLAARR